MLFSQNLIQGTLLKRYKRFLCDVKLDSGEIVVAHCANSGSMLSVLPENAKVFLSKIHSKTAKLTYRLEIIVVNNNLVGVNTSNTNKIVHNALQNKKISSLSQYNTIKAEVKFSNDCRFDFFLSDNNDKSANCFLEVKNVSMSRQVGLAEFPDSVTARGLKHLKKLIEAKQNGFAATIIYVIQREDCNNFCIAKDIDKDYYEQLKIAISSGVEVLCYNCSMNNGGIWLNLPVNVTI